MTIAQAAAGGMAARREDAGARLDLRGHLPALDGIRGVAILLVMIFHTANSLEMLGVGTPLLKPFDLGWCGVDVFFALSGFLITGILLDRKTAPNYFKSFYARRILRIFPLYYLALFAVFVVRAALPDAGVWGEYGAAGAPGSLLWPALFLENAAILIGGGAGTGSTGHYWSLAVEEHFYLVWPFLVWIARDRRQVLMLAIAAAAASMIGRVLVLEHALPLHRVFGVSPLRMDGLAIGAITAVLVRSWPRERLVRWAAVLLPGALLAACTLVLVRRTVSDTDPGLWLAFYPLVSIGTAAAIVLSLGAKPFATLMGVRPLRWFGKYSYGLYVWHPIIGILLFHSSIALARPGDPPERVIAAGVAVVALDLLVAWLSFELWEKRFLALKGLFTPERKAPAPAVQPAAAE